MLQGVKVNTQKEILLAPPYPPNQLDTNGEPELVAVPTKRI
jgi:hypothetical protein